MIAPLDTEKIRQDFPMYGKEGKAFAYLDSASSSQTPLQVLEAMENFYHNYRANVHRGMYKASETATERFEAVRRKVADLIQAKEDEIVFTRGTTESLNLLARTLSKGLKAGDEVVITAMEHHANLVPWQQLGIERGFVVKHIPIKKDYTLDMDAAKALITPATKVVSAMHASNVLGTIVPIKELAAMAHAQGAVFVVDAAQSMGHLPVNVKAIDCDFLAFSGHKMLGPTGVGVLYGKKRLLEAMDPFLFGGDMIQEVFWDKSTWNEVPWKFEAGTPNIAGVIGLGAAVDYVKLTGIDRIEAHEKKLARYAMEKLAVIPGLKFYGPSADKERIGVVSFELEGIHPHDVATILDAEGVCVRGGHHCAMPLMRDLGLVNGTTRASFSVYSTEADVDALVLGLLKARRIFSL
jgi:cysteine desulfurase/selenocysteine lyase